jgi:hypothetical protein
MAADLKHGLSNAEGDAIGLRVATRVGFAWPDSARQYSDMFFPDVREVSAEKELDRGRRRASSEKVVEMLTGNEPGSLG